MPLPTTLNDLVLLVTYNKLSAFSARQLFPIALYRKAAENGKKNISDLVFRKTAAMKL